MQQSNMHQGGGEHDHSPGTAQCEVIASTRKHAQYEPHIPARTLATMGQ